MKRQSKNLKKQIIDTGKEVFLKEGKELLRICDSLNDEFFKAVNLLLNSNGKIVVLGIGKSGLVGRKIASTFTSTGTPSIFVHPADALHGDIGIVNKNDVSIIISKSGESDEIIKVAKILCEKEIPIICITANKNSLLSKLSDVRLIININEEACSMNIAPTTSSTASLVMGDALAIALSKIKNISKEKILEIHPAGSIGRKLSLLVKDVMLTGSYVPIVRMDDDMKKVLTEMTSKRGITSVVDKKGILKGVITDGDMRRYLEKGEEIFKLKAKDIMTKNPKTINPESSVEYALNMMERNRVSALIVVDTKMIPKGIIHLHDILQRGIF